MTTTRKSTGYPTEYTDNFTADKLRGGTWDKSSSGLFDGKTIGASRSCPVGPNTPPAPTQEAYNSTAQATGMPGETRDPAVFASQTYPSVYRETTIRKDDRGQYIDPYKYLVSKPDGRRLLYDPSHPDKMYPSQWSSELADHPGCYSFPTTTGLEPQIPFTQNMQWQSEGEVGAWPTDLWKTWTQTAASPQYDGHDDQVEYSKYKVQVP